MAFDDKLRGAGIETRQTNYIAPFVFRPQN